MNSKHYVVAYDVTNTRRRNRLARWLLNFAYRVQYSVFEMKADVPTMKVVVDGIKRHVNKDEDSVIIYELDSDDWRKKILLGLQTKEREFYEQEYTILG